MNFQSATVCCGWDRNYNFILDQLKSIEWDNFRALELILILNKVDQSCVSKTVAVSKWCIWTFSQMFTFFPENETGHSGEQHDHTNTFTIQLSATPENEEETVEPNLEGNICSC